MNKDADHEAKCERCGVSCHFTATVPDGRNVAVWGLHCKFLRRTGDKAECSVYEDRFEKAPWCHHADQAQPLGMLRVGCPYNGDGAGKTALRGEEYDAVWPGLLPGVLCQVWPEWIDPDAFLAELKQREPDKEWEYVPKHKGHVFQPKGEPPTFLFVSAVVSEPLG